MSEFIYEVWAKGCKCETEWLYLSGVEPHCAQCGMVFYKYTTPAQLLETPPTTEHIQNQMHEMLNTAIVEDA